MSLFNTNDLKNRARKFNQLSEAAYAKLLNESVRKIASSQVFDIFLSHSIKDAAVIYGLKKKIEDMGYSVYVDWDVDRRLDRSRVDKETAKLLKFRMESCNSLFFATSENSSKSIWMPWELGYFDGHKRDKVAILPISASSRGDDYKGQEYLGLYPYVTTGYTARTSNEKLWIHDSIKKYVNFDSWLNGIGPQNH